MLLLGWDREFIRASVWRNPKVIATTIDRILWEIAQNGKGMTIGTYK